ncbi:MAG: LrgB family protein [Cohaesibacter sp.]|nr:LrgB family protein [Cohaesibacter sp.]MCV6601910.1 LrgB family protein [Cohaesibacter sp.]
MMQDLQSIWVYLSASPLLHLFLTLLAYQIGQAFYKKSGMMPLLNPVMIAVILLVLMLVGTGTSYESYFSGAQFVHFLLGPATVALAIPLYRQFNKVKRSALALSLSLLCGSITAAASAVLIAIWLGGAEKALVSLATKSVTAPVAMGITKELGGLPSLTAVLVITTGIIGAMFGPYILNLVGVKNWAARGFAIGTASHGIGTARAMQVNEEAGAFSGLAMGLNALATSLLLPLIWFWVF